MAKSIKLKNNMYWDSTSITHNKEKLSDKLNNLEHYSTEETFTGKYWIDGKKIYRKVISVSNREISNATLISTGVSNLKDLISLNGVYYNATYKTKVPYPLLQNTGTVINCTYLENANGSYISFVGNETYSASPDRIHTFILEYTKTTE